VKVEDDLRARGMTDMTRNEVSPVNTLFLRYIYLVLAIIIIAAFFLLFGQTSVWFDEANYLVIAGAIRETGYPIWFGDPDKPSIFIDSPPGLLYLINIFSTYVTNNLFLGRVDKLNPDADGGKQHECGEALGQFVVAGGDPT
jgi:hypothetical protein